MDYTQAFKDAVLNTFVPSMASYTTVRTVRKSTRPASGVYGPDSTGTYYRYRQSDDSIFSVRPPGAWTPVAAGSSAHHVAVSLIPKLARLNEEQAVALSIGRVGKGPSPIPNSGSLLSLLPNALLPESMQQPPELPPAPTPLPPWVLPVAVAGGVALLALVLLPPRQRVPTYGAPRSYEEVR